MQRARCTSESGTGKRREVSLVLVCPPRYTPAEWQEVNNHMRQRVRDRRKEAVTGRDNSVKLRSGNDTQLRRKSIEVKNQFIGRKSEVERKTMQLKLLKQKLDTERGMMHGAIATLVS